MHTHHRRSIAVYELHAKKPYDDAVDFDMEAFRVGLRRLREQRVGGREKLAAMAGINKTTIQSIEKDDDIPGLDTLAKIAHGMKLELHEFFREIARLQNAVLTPPGKAAHTAGSAPPSGEVAHGGGPSVLSGVDGAIPPAYGSVEVVAALANLGDAIVSAVDDLGARLTGGAQAAASSHPRKAGRGDRRRRGDKGARRARE